MSSAISKKKKKKKEKTACKGFTDLSVSAISAIRIRFFVKGLTEMM